MEQVLRFLSLVEATDKELLSVGDMGGVYLDEKMISIAKDDEFDRRQMAPPIQRKLLTYWTTQ